MRSGKKCINLIRPLDKIGDPKYLNLIYAWKPLVEKCVLRILEYDNPLARTDGHKIDDVPAVIAGSLYVLNKLEQPVAPFKCNRAKRFVFIGLAMPERQTDKLIM